MTGPISVPLSRLATLPRVKRTADFHCVAGWSATQLQWEGVAFQTFYRTLIEPSIRPGAPITHVTFDGFDGYRSTVRIEDALADDVLIADRLDGRPLDPDHGAPVRLVSPSQYGFVSTKHLSRVEVHTRRPAQTVRHASRISQLSFRVPWARTHPRARVWQEERHTFIPARLLRPVYRLLIPPIAFLSARGSRSRSRGRAVEDDAGG